MSVELIRRLNAAWSGEVSEEDFLEWWLSNKAKFVSSDIGRKTDEVTEKALELLSLDYATFEDFDLSGKLGAILV